MNTKKIFFSVLGIAMLAISCSKTNVQEIIDGSNNNLAPDYQIEFYNGARLEASYNSALNMPNLAKAIAAYSIKNSTVHIRIGNNAAWNLPGNRYEIEIDIPHKQQAAEIAGTYNFSEAANKSMIKLTEITKDNKTIIRTMPVGGSLTINYSETTKRLSGKLAAVRFQQTGSSSFDELNGTFKHLGIE